MIKLQPYKNLDTSIKIIPNNSNYISIEDYDSIYIFDNVFFYIIDIGDLFLYSKYFRKVL